MCLELRPIDYRISVCLSLLLSVSVSLYLSLPSLSPPSLPPSLSFLSVLLCLSVSHSACLSLYLFIPLSQLCHFVSTKDLGLPLSNYASREQQHQRRIC